MMRKKQDAHWMSISDMMSALMIIFMFIAIAFMTKINEQKSKMAGVVTKYSDTKKNIHDALKKEFDKDLQDWGGTLDKDTLSIRFNFNEENKEEGAVFFDQGSPQLKPYFKDVLDVFMPRYINVLSKEEFKNDIAEVRIEGHTSSEWDGKTEKRDAYLKNMKLSQDRTRSVLEYTLNMKSLSDKEEWLKKYITANGLSSSQLIRKADGTEDSKKSRRVEFRVRTTADDKLVEMEQYTK